MAEDKDFDRALNKAEETLINQGIDPAELKDPAKDKAELAQDIEGKI